MIDRKNFIYTKNENQWKNILKIGVNKLLNDSIVNKDYWDTLIKEIDRLGFYFIISKDIALVHIAPGNENLKTNLCLQKLDQPIYFSSNEHHRVRFCIYLTSVSSNDHLEKLKLFSKIFSNKEFVFYLQDITTFDEYKNLYEKYFN